MTRRVARQGSRRVAHAAALGALLGVALAGACAPKPEPRTHTVVMEALKFQPRELTVRAGDTVVWVNKDMFPHTATSKSGGFDSGAIAAEASWKHTIGQRGEFAYVCTYHPTMTGKLVVE